MMNRLFGYMMSHGKTKRKPNSTGQPHPVAATSAAIAVTAWPQASLTSRLAWLKGWSGLFWFALLTSLLIHVTLLALGVSLPRVNPDNLFHPPLELVLVNSKSVRPPDHADALAQSNLDGGGNTDADRHAQSPLPASALDAQQQDVRLAEEQVRQLEAENRQLMLQLKARQAMVQTTAGTSTEGAPDSSDSGHAADPRTQQEMAKLEARIARQYMAYEKRPRKLFIGARTREYAFARYVEDWRVKIERIGNQHYPPLAREDKIFGKLQLTVSIRADGSLESIVINKSSGSPLLDQAAVSIVRMSAPFSPFPQDMRNRADVIAITRTWSFEPGNQLNTQE